MVGNRYRLNARQQKALIRMSVAETAIRIRNEKVLLPADLQDETVAIDGFNCLILLESALSGAYLFQGLDSVYRDLSGVHGSYKKVQQSEKAIQLVGQTLTNLGVKKVHWYLDQPVSNSGRLKARLLDFAAKKDWDWAATLVFNPDKELAEHSAVVISSDGWVLDRAGRWFNLMAFLLDTGAVSPFVVYGAVDLRKDGI